jgi:hypothetical protein
MYRLIVIEQMVRAKAVQSGSTSQKSLRAIRALRTHSQSSMQARYTIRDKTIPSLPMIYLTEGPLQFAVTVSASNMRSRCIIHCLTALRVQR